MRTTPSVRRGLLFWALQLGGWALFGGAMLVAGLTQWPVRYAVVNKTSLTLFGFAASLLLRVVYRALGRACLPAAAIAAAALPLSFGAAAVWMALHHELLRRAVAPPLRAPGLLPAPFPDFTNTIYFLFVLVAWSALYFGAQAYLDLLDERDRRWRSEALAHQARLQALRLQLNPHFLFNTLNSISTLVSDARLVEANQMLGKLAAFLRRTLDAAEADEIPLSEEIEFARQYLEIEETRFGDRLQVAIDMDPAARSALVPAMILQPLVENAVRHGILPRLGGGSISITASRLADRLTVAVEDDGPGCDGSTENEGGVGLTNTRRRLAELYGGGAELRLERNARGTFAASIFLPFRAGEAR